MAPDAPTVRKLANKVTFRANLLLVACGILGAGAGVVGGIIGLEALNRYPEVLGRIRLQEGVPIVAGAGALLGLVIGAALAADLKLRAQVALALTQVEQNTKTLKKTMSKVARHLGESGSGEYEA